MLWMLHLAPGWNFESVCLLLEYLDIGELWPHWHQFDRVWIKYSWVVGLDCDTLLDHLLGCSSLLPWERFGELGFCVFHSTSVLVSCHDVIVFMQEIPFLTTSCFSCWRWFYLCHCQRLNISRLTLKAHFSEIWSLFSLKTWYLLDTSVQAQHQHFLNAH